VCPELNRKFGIWNENNHEWNASLVLSILHPISKQRIEGYVALIKVKEIPEAAGFTVLTVEAVRVDALKGELKQCVLDLRNALNKKHSSDVSCIAIFDVEAIGSDVNDMEILVTHSFGEYHELPLIKKTARNTSTRQSEWIARLNKLWV
jgi:hypothetical protein